MPTRSTRVTNRPTGQHLVGREGQRFWFDAGAVCLDFGYTGGAGVYSVFEQLHRPADLQRWLAASALDVHVAHLTPADLVAACDLREAMRQTSWAVAAGEPPRRAWLSTINGVASGAPLTARLAADRSSSWVSPTIDQVLATMARELVDLVSGEDADRFRACEADDCPLVFVDTSRAGSRRWCSMARCGNRHKVRAFRERLT